MHGPCGQEHCDCGHEIERLTRQRDELRAALEAYMNDDECVNTPDAPDFTPGPHTKCRYCDAAIAIANCKD